MCASPAIVPVGPCVCRFLNQVLLWFGLELPRKGNTKGGGVRDARVKVNPIHRLTSGAQDPETQPQFAQPGGRGLCTAFYWKSPTKDFFAHELR